MESRKNNQPPPNASQKRINKQSYREGTPIVQPNTADRFGDITQIVKKAFPLPDVKPELTKSIFDRIKDKFN